MDDPIILDLRTGEMRHVDPYAYRGVGLPDDLVWLDDLSGADARRVLGKFMRRAFETASALSERVQALEDELATREPDEREALARLEYALDNLEQRVRDLE